MAEQHGIFVAFKSNAGESLNEAADAADSAKKSIGQMGRVAGGALAKASSGVSSLRAGLNKMGAGAGRAFAAAGDGITVLNQGLEVGKKAMELWRSTVVDSIDTALRFREEGDETLAFFDGMKRESELVKARIGDALLPVMQGFIESLGATKGEISGWIEQNRKLIGSELVSWVAKVGKLLITGVAKGTEAVVTIWKGWEMLVGTLRGALEAFFGATLSGIEKLLEALATAAEFYGKGDMAKSLRNTAAAAKALGEEFSRSSDESIKGVQESASSLDELTGKIDELEKGALKRLEAGATHAQKAVQKSVAGTNKTLEEQAKAADEAKQAHEELAAARAAAAAEATKAMMDEVRSVQDKAKAEYEARGQTMAAEAQVKADAGASVRQAATQALGSIGGIIEGAMAGGPAGAIQAGIIAVMQESEVLQEAFSKVANLFGELVAAIDPVFQALMPIVDVASEVVSTLIGLLEPVLAALAEAVYPVAKLVEALIPVLVTMSPAFQALNITMNALVPVIELLAEVLQQVSAIIMEVAIQLSEAWNSIVGAVAGILKELGDVKIFGKRPLGKLKDWANDLEDSATVSTDAIRETRDEMLRGAAAAAESADDLEDGSESIADAVNQVSGNMLNVPAGVKVALERFRAAEPVTAGGDRRSAEQAYFEDYGDMPWSVRPKDGDPITGGGGNTWRVENVILQNVANVTQLANYLADEAERTATAEDGPLAVNRSSGMGGVLSGTAREAAGVA